MIEDGDYKELEKKRSGRRCHYLSCRLKYSEVLGSVPTHNYHSHDLSVFVVLLGKSQLRNLIKQIFLLLIIQ